MTRPIAPPGWQHRALPVRQGPHGVRIMCLLRMRPEGDEFSLAFCSVIQAHRRPGIYRPHFGEPLKCAELSLWRSETATDLSNMADELRMNCGNKDGKTLRVHFGVSRRDRPLRVKPGTRPTASGRQMFLLASGNGRSPRTASGSCVAQRTF